MQRLGMKQLRNSLDLKKFSLIVLGNSVEGLACANEAAKLGATVGILSKDNSNRMLENEAVLNFLHYSAKCKTELKEAKLYSWKFNFDNNNETDWKTLMDSIKPSVSNYCRERIEFFKNKNIVYIDANPKFLDTETVIDRESGKIFWSNYYLISPSSSLKFPDIPGASKYGFLLADLLNVDKLQGKILIVGDGRQALQLASCLVRLKYDTTLLMKNDPVPSFDRQMTQLFIDSMASSSFGLKILSKCILNFINKNSDGKLEIHYTKLGKEWRSHSIFDNIIFVPYGNCDLTALELSAADIIVENNKIPTNDKFQTKKKHIYAVGDVLEHTVESNMVSVQIGRNIARYMFGNKTNVIDIYDLVGSINGDIDYCYIGLTEEDAIRHYGENMIEIYHSFYQPTEFFTLGKSTEQCYLKMICLMEKQEKIIGMHFIGPFASNVIQGFAVALKCGITRDQLKNIIDVFPTVAREFILLNITKRSGIDPFPAACCS